MEAVIVNILQNSRRHFSVLNLAILLTVSLIFAITGCDPSQLAELDEHAGHSHESSSNNQVEPEIHSNGQAHNQTNSQSNGQNPNQQQTPQIVIGSFNIQMFGKTKMGKPGVVSILTDIARRFDILAIQELRDKDQGVIPEFLRQINADGSSYAAAVGPRQGYIVAGQTTSSNLFSSTTPPKSNWLARPMQHMTAIELCIARRLSVSSVASTFRSNRRLVLP